MIFVHSFKHHELANLSQVDQLDGFDVFDRLDENVDLAAAPREKSFAHDLAVNHNKLACSSAA